MRVKRYVVDTMPDAMLKIRKDLGSEAIILSTKKVKIGGIFGLFGKPKLEVIAGIDADERSTPTGERMQSQIKPPSAPAGAARVPVLKSIQAEASASLFAGTKAEREIPANHKASVQETIKPILPGKGFAPQAYQRTAQLLDGLQETAAAAKHDGAFKETSEAAEEAIPVSVGATSGEIANEQFEVESKAFDQFREQLEKARHASAAAEIQEQPARKEMTTSPADTDFRDHLLEDIRQMKALISELSQAQKGERLLPAPLPEIRERLRLQQVDTDLIDSWLGPIYETWKSEGEQTDEHQLKQEVTSRLEQFLEGRISEGFAENTRIVYVAGPTGVGKTTTIAKMAADQTFRKQKKVGFITADTYRISAVDQLRTYATILNVPLEVVQSPGDMKRAVTKLEDCDLIFMDTAGRNYLNELYVAELHSLLTYRDNSETCLVLSLTAKPEDLRAIVERFSGYGLDKVIFTKLDETNSFGAMFNLLAEYPLQLLYLTNGQTVPDDILPVNGTFLVKELLGEAAL